MESPSADKKSAQKSVDRAPFWRKILHLRNEVALTLVALSVSGAIVVVPRPTYPQVLPLPIVDTAQIRLREKEEVRRALSVADGSLDKEARAIGELFRRLGRTLADKHIVTGPKLDALRKDARDLLAREASSSAPSGAEALLSLRALQGQLFLDAVAAFESTGKLNDDLLELGGPFHTIARESWLKDGKILLNDDELRLFFRVHWGKLTGLYGVEPFGPSLEELRRYYFTNLIHPPGASGDTMTRAANQLGFVRALGNIESTYPAALAEGILQLQLGQPVQALESLNAHLAQHPDGEWTHLARSHFILATRQVDAIAQAGP